MQVRTMPDSEMREIWLDPEQYAWLLSLVERENRRNLDSGTTALVAAIASGEASVAHKVQTILRQARPPMEPDLVTPQEVASSFHAHYEHLAPTFGFEGRSHLGFEQMDEHYRGLLVATVRAVMDEWFSEHLADEPSAVERSRS